MRRAATVQAVDLRDVKANPYRHEKTYKLDEERIKALLESYSTTGFWDGSIQGRPSPTEPGKIEVAFGHHRIEAARRAKLGEVGIVVSDRDNAQMLQMLIHENRREFGHDATVAVESVAAVLDAYAKGEIKLEPAPEGSPKGGGTGVHEIAFPGGKPIRYTMLTVARFMGWTKAGGTQATAAMRDAFEAYHEREAVKIAREEIPASARSAEAVKSVARASRLARQEATRKYGKGATDKIDEAAKVAAREQAKAVTKSSGKQARHMPRETAERAVWGGKRPEKQAPRLVGVLERLVGTLAGYLSDDDPTAIKIREAVPLVADRTVVLNSETFPDWRTQANVVAQVVTALRHLSKRADALADALAKAREKRIA